MKVGLHAGSQGAWWALRRPVLAVFVLTVGALPILAGSAVSQENYPSRPIHFIVPFPPGGTTDPLARILGDELSQITHQSVIIDNRPGGNTIIGTDLTAKARPDGYTMLLVTPSFLTMPYLESVPYDTSKDFTPVATAAASENVILVSPQLPVNNLQELIALAKSEPGKLNYGHPGVGGIDNITAEQFKQKAGVDITAIPYQGGGQLLTDLMVNQIQVAFQGPASVIQLIKAGKLKALAVSGSARLPELPDVPTYAESGMPDFDARLWMGVAMRAGTPKAIVDKLSADIGAAVALPDFKKKIGAIGFEPFYSTPAQTGALITGGMANYAQVIKAAHIKLQN